MRLIASRQIYKSAILICESVYASRNTNAKKKEWRKEIGMDTIRSDRYVCVNKHTIHTCVCVWIREAYTNKHSVRVWRYERSHQKVLEEGRRSYWQNRDRDAMSVSAVSVRPDAGLLVLLLRCWTRAHPLKVSPSILNITVKLARLRCSFLPLARVLAFLPGFLLSCRGMDFGL